MNIDIPQKVTPIVTSLVARAQISSIKITFDIDGNPRTTNDQIKIWVKFDRDGLYVSSYQDNDKVAQSSISPDTSAKILKTLAMRFKETPPTIQLGKGLLNASSEQQEQSRKQAQDIINKINDNLP